MLSIDLLRSKPETVDIMYQVAEFIKNGELGNNYVYCTQDGNFYVYIKGYWKALHAAQMAKIIEEHFRFITKFPSAKRHQVLDNLEIIIQRELTEFNILDLINFPQGMFDPKGNNLIKHDEKYLSTIRIPYDYNMMAECPLWLKTLDGIFEGDEDKAEILQEFFGYCLTRDTKREKALLLLGETRSGKSTILETIVGLIGEENCSSVTLDSISNPQFTPLLINKLVNIDWDVNATAEDYEANFKIITTGEPIRVNQKFIKAFTFRPYCKMIMAANKFPRITDHSSAFYTRLILLPCNRQFSPHEQDIDLKVKLKQELPGIFNWAVKGLIRLEQRKIFEVNKKFMTDAIEELREESNPVDVFFKENVVIDVSGPAEIEKQILYSRYCEWCRSNGNAPMANNKFGSVVYAKYSKYTPKNTMNHMTMKRVWKNLKLIDVNAIQGEPIEWKERI